MDTRIFKINDPVRDAALIDEAGRILRGGGLVVFPTETVYGLGANALDPQAAARIYAAKGRPQDNPLIVHICDMAQLELLCHDIPAEARTLAAAYWPGPLTMVLPKNESIPDATTAGLDTAGIRMPSDRIARALIKSAGVPIAAPSANISGKPSATSFEHVVNDMFGRVDALIDSGESQVGLESTVVEFENGCARILRPGFITKDDIEAVLGEGKCLISSGVMREPEKGERVRSPGMKYRHYAPAAPVIAICGKSADAAREMLRRVRGQADCAVIICDEYLPLMPCRAVGCGRDGDLAAMAHRLFAALRELDRGDISFILAQCPEESGLGLAIANRLKRAAAFRVVQARRLFVLGLTGPSGSGKSTLTRLFAEAGAHVVDCDKLYHEMLDTDDALKEAIGEVFPEAISKSGLDRKALGRIVFSDPGKLEKLNETVLPIVRQRLEEIVQDAEAAGEGLLVLDAPTLFESGADSLCDETCAVLAPESARIKRIMERDGLDESYARLRIEGGKDEDFYRDRAGRIIVNDSELDGFRREAEEYKEQIMSRRSYI